MRHPRELRKGTKSPAAIGVAGVLFGLLGVAAACSSDGDSAETREAERGPVLSQSADQGVCSADATALDAPYEGFPEGWSFPEDTDVYDVEDRGETGVIVTAISTTPLDEVLTFLNDAQTEPGYRITGGETEEDDAEADWRSDGFTGRWTIRTAPACPDETLIQVLATPAG